jgi:hypothetical protein
VSGDPIPFLWLCGPSGVGKTTVGWELYARLGAAGIRAAYVDADQLGLCYPAPADDKDNHRVKARSLGLVWPVFRAAGARCLIMSGCVDTPGAVRLYGDQVPDTTITLCRLRVDAGELRERFVRRGWSVHLADRAVRDAEALDRADFSDVCVETSGRSVAEVVELVREQTGGWPGESPESGDALGPEISEAGSNAGIDSGDAAPFLWLYGARGTGKSVVGYEIFTQVVRSGVKAAYVDLAQIGHCRPAPDDDPGNHRIKVRNLARMWPAFRAAGARCLIIVGAVDEPDTADTYRDAVPGTDLTLCRLTASPDELVRRMLWRGRGEGPALPGETLSGRPDQELRGIAEDAARADMMLDRAGIGGFAVHTDGRSVEQVAELIRALAGGWPGLAAQVGE